VGRKNKTRDYKELKAIEGNRGYSVVKRWVGAANT
jgi:hypothetical protein